MRQPIKFSIILPTFNRANVIQNAIRSVIDQTYGKWELIIVDDGSKDFTKTIVDSFVDSRIKYYYIEHIPFVSEVRDYGCRKAEGEIFVVQDSDDLSLPHRLEMILDAYMANEDCEAFYHSIIYRVYDNKHNAMSRFIKRAEPFNKQRAISQQYMPGPLAYTRKAYEKAPYRKGIYCMDDHQIIIDMAMRGIVFKDIPEVLYEAVSQADSINITGEVDGRRKKDAETFIKFLKEDYNTDATAVMKSYYEIT